MIIQGSLWERTSKIYDADAYEMATLRRAQLQAEGADPILVPIHHDGRLVHFNLSYNRRVEWSS